MAVGSEIAEESELDNQRVSRSGTEQFLARACTRKGFDLSSIRGSAINSGRMSLMMTWTNKQGGYTFTGELELAWEVNGSAMSDDYLGAHEISAVDLLRKWTEKYFPDKKAPHGNVVPIYWSIHGDATESAPFVPAEWRFNDSNFLTYFTWPTDVDSGERVNFNRLSVQDKVWNTEHWDKGGFIQEATGWKPSPFEPVMYVPTVYAAAGLGHLAPLT